MKKASKPGEYVSDLQSEITELRAEIKALKEREITYDDAWRVIERDYWDDVRGICADIETRCKSGEISEDDLSDALHEAVDGTQRVIYTHQARVGMACTDSPEAYQDATGEPAPTVEAAMFWAMLTDISERLDLDWDEIREALDKKESETE